MTTTEPFGEHGVFTVGVFSMITATAHEDDDNARPPQLLRRALTPTVFFTVLGVNAAVVAALLVYNRLKMPDYDAAMRRSLFSYTTLVYLQIISGVVFVCALGMAWRYGPLRRWAPLLLVAFAYATLVNMLVL